MESVQPSGCGEGVLCSKTWHSSVSPAAVGCRGLPAAPRQFSAFPCCPDLGEAGGSQAQRALAPSQKKNSTPLGSSSLGVLHLPPQPHTHLGACSLPCANSSLWWWQRYFLEDLPLETATVHSSHDGSESARGILFGEINWLLPGIWGAMCHHPTMETPAWPLPWLQGKGCAVTNPQGLKDALSHLN